MSLAQLEKQIEIANLALAKAEEKGGSRKNKAAIKEELAQFTKVLVKSKARLRELEAIKQQCDEFSACRDAPERKPIGGISVKKMNSWKTRETKAEDEQATKSVVESKKEQRLNDDDSYYKPIVIPWLQKKADDKMTEETKRQIKALSEKLEGDVRETRDEEEGSVVSKSNLSYQNCLH